MSFVSAVVDFFKREPVAVLIGGVGTLVTVAEQLYTHQTTVLIALPAILAVITRFIVTSPAAAAKLKAAVAEAQNVVPEVEGDVPVAVANQPVVKEVEDVVDASITAVAAAEDADPNSK